MFRIQLQQEEALHKDLLVLKAYKSIQIISPREFFDYLLNHGL